MLWRMSAASSCLQSSAQSSYTKSSSRTLLAQSSSRTLLAQSAGCASLPAALETKVLDLNKTQLTYYSRGGPCAHCHQPIAPGSECYSDGSGFAHRSCGHPFGDVPLTDPIKLVEVRYRQHLNKNWEFHSEATLFEGPLLAGFHAFGERCALRAQQGYILKWEFDPEMLLAPAFAMLHGTNGRGDRSMLIWFRETSPVRTARPLGEKSHQPPAPVAPTCSCGGPAPIHGTDSGHRTTCPMHESFLNFLVQNWWEETPALCFRSETVEVEEDPFEGCPGSGPLPKFAPPRERTLLDALPPSRREELQQPVGAGSDFSPRGSRTPSGVEAEQMKVLRGTFTVPGNPHRTFKIEGPDRGRKFKPEAFIISLLAGPDNESDYVSFGFVEVESGQPVVRVWQSKQGWLTPEVREAASRLLVDPMTAGETYAMRSKRCFRCGRKLTVPVSLSRGLGPECAERIGK